MDAEGCRYENPSSSARPPPDRFLGRLWLDEREDTELWRERCSREADPSGPDGKDGMVGTEERRAKLSEKDVVRGSGWGSWGETDLGTAGEALSDEFKSGEDVTTDIAGGRRKADLGR